MTTTDSESRAVLRKAFRKRRAALGVAQQVRHGLAALAQLQRLIAQLPVQRVGLYLSMKDELDTAPTLEWLLDRDVIVGLPAITDLSAGIMVFRQFQPGTPMHRGQFGIMEPDATAPELAVADFDLLLMPLVAFDGHGRRLGMGGGFYDRALAAVPAGSRPGLVGLAHSAQHSEVPLPNAPWDVPLDAVITELALNVYAQSGPLAGLWESRAD